QSQGSKCAQRLCSVVGTGETSEGLARFRAGRRKIQALPYSNRTSRSSAAKNPRDRHDAIKSGTSSFCRSGKKNRSKQVADRSFQANPERTSHAGESHSRCSQGLGQNSKIRLGSSFGRHPLRRSREGERDAAISARYVLRLNGHAGPIREARDRGLLLRHSHRERLAGETKARMADRL